MRTVSPQQPERGMALLAVLVFLMFIAGSSASLIWLMNQQQARAGAHLRSVAALAAAEAGMHRAITALESTAPDGRTAGRAWRPAGYTEAFRSGALSGGFTVTLTDEPGGAILVTSVGEITGVTRRVRARVYLASPGMLAALYGAGLVQIEKAPAQMLLLPYGPGASSQPWVHVAAGGGIRFGVTEGVINDPSGRFDAGPGPLDAFGLAAAEVRSVEPARLVLARGAELSVGTDHRSVDVQRLRVMGIRVDAAVVWTEAFPKPPGIDRPFLQALAAANTANAALNEAAGKYVGDDELVLKRDSLYSQDQFARLQTYFQTGNKPAQFRGIIFVRGPVALSENQRMVITDGALITEGTLRLRWGAALEVVHSPATRALPGVIVLDPGALIVAQSARLRVHGLVYASRTIDVWEGARIDVVGAVLGGGQELSFRNLGASVVIRYDPAVLGTPGLLVGDDAPVVAWIASWEELP